MMLRNEEGKGRISLDDSDGIKHVASVIDLMSQGREGNWLVWYIYWLLKVDVERNDSDGIKQVLLI